MWIKMRDAVDKDRQGRHQCVMPEPEQATGVRNNDVWECDTCMALFIVTVESDQRDQTTWFTWREVVISDAQ